MFKRWRQDESGATAIEYALVASLIFVAAVTGINLMMNGTHSLYGGIKNAFDTHMSGS